jgi:subtilisin family serine protease
MKHLINFCNILVLLSLLGCAQDGGSPHASQCATPKTPINTFETASLADGELRLLLKFKNLAADFTEFRRALAAAHAPVVGELGKMKMIVVHDDLLSLDLPAGSPARTIVHEYIQSGLIDYVEEDHETFAIEPDEVLETTDVAPETELSDAEVETNKQLRTIVIAVIDSGVDYTHRALAPFIWKNVREVKNGKDDDGNGYVDDVMGWDFVNHDNNPMADDTRSYHGTHVAGIVKQASQLLKIGVAVKIMPLKYLDSQGSGRSSNAIRAIDYAIRNGAQILNNSWGSFSSSQALSDAIERARRRGVLFLAAAGNGDSQGKGVNIDRRAFYPAAYSHNNIVTVAATDKYRKLMEWSNFGANKVDLAAPGSKILSTRNGNRFAVLSGTSMATPHVAGILGALWAMRPDLNYLEVRKVLFQSVDKLAALRGKLATSGSVNPSRAAQMARIYSHSSSDKDGPDFSVPAPCAL